MALGYKINNGDDNSYTFFETELKDKEYLEFNLGKELYLCQLFGQWSNPVQDQRFMGNHAGLLFKTANQNPKVLYFDARSIVSQRKLKVVINQKEITTLTINLSKANFSVPIKNIKKGINRIDFYPEKVTDPLISQSDKPQPTVSMVKLEIKS